MGGGDYVLLLAAKNGESTQVQRLAQSGVLVVSDRFPQAEFRAFIMTDRGSASNVRPGKQHVSGAARTAFIPKNGAIPSELIIRLGIDIDTAISRKPDLTMPSCRTKSASCRRLAITAKNS